MKKTTIALLSEFAPLEPTYALVSDVDLVMVRSGGRRGGFCLVRKMPAPRRPDGGRPYRRGQSVICGLHNPDFSAYAELCGAMGVRVSKVGQLDAALEKALSHPSPALVEVMTDVELI
jgi:Thiamine pyrophosphate enzyme, C-terminal TPP binding domain